MSLVFDPNTSLTDALANRRAVQEALENGALLVAAAKEEVARRTDYAAAYIKQNLGSEETIRALKGALEKGVQVAFVDSVCTSVVSSLQQDTGYQGGLAPGSTSKLMGVLLGSFAPMGLLSRFQFEAHGTADKPVEGFLQALSSIDEVAKEVQKEIQVRLSQPDLPGLVVAYKKLVDAPHGSLDHRYAYQRFSRAEQAMQDAENGRSSRAGFGRSPASRFVDRPYAVLQEMLALGQKEVRQGPSSPAESQRVEHELAAVSSPTALSSAPKPR